MSTIKLSEHRKRLRALLKAVGQQTFYCAYSDTLIRGTPGKVYRTCGKKNCRCAQDPANRHGPYLVIQCYREEKQKQIALRKDQKNLWQKAINYQKQIKILGKLRISCDELITKVEQIIQSRIEQWP